MQKISKISEEVFLTQHCSIHQCDERDSFILNLFGDELEMELCSFIAFKKQVLDFKLEAALLDDSHAGIEIMRFGCLDRIFVFTLEQLIEIRNLLDGSFAMLEVNSIMHRAMRRNFF